MTRKLIIALAIVGVVGVFGAAANAQAAEFKASGEPATILGEQDGTGKTAHQVFALAGVKVTCKKVSMLGTQSAKIVASLTLTATYGECEMINSLISVPATVVMNNCDFLIHSTGEFDITSNTGSTCNKVPIAIEGKTTEGKFCDISIGSQSSLKKMAFSTIVNGTTKKKEITAETNLTGIKYEANGSFCNETGMKTNGAVETGNVVLSAIEDKMNGNQFDYSFE
jgi:hypothetical protein